jgi:KUP system potassium uptake protein
MPLHPCGDAVFSLARRRSRAGSCPRAAVKWADGLAPRSARAQDAQASLPISCGAPRAARNAQPRKPAVTGDGVASAAARPADAAAREGAPLAVLMLGALGVVYGDIGTSPLYALRECFSAQHGVAATRGNLFGVLSLMVWTLVLIVCIKYVVFLLRADHRGEGGILAMMTLAFDERRASKRRRAVLVAAGVFGAALLYGDGVITPCITVMGALEGLEVATPMFSPYVLPLSIAILIALFAWQGFGSGYVGRVLGPIMLVWFAALAVLGVRGIAEEPEILAALLPWHGFAFVVEQGLQSLIVIGAVFLVVTGAEALYADLGHFGRVPIQLAWFCVAFPALLLNYLGQGALLLHDPGAARNPFFLLAPAWGLYPLVILATAASVIASQAVITGAFSITMQAIQLGFLPRLEIRHTSADERGQIYLPQVNRMLLIGCICLCLGFGSSSNLAGAYGTAVTLTMLITTLLFFFVARRLWRWSIWTVGFLCLLFGSIELLFFAGNALKIAHGGWFPVLVAALICTVMFTWRRGRQLLYERHAARLVPLEDFLVSLQREMPIRVPGTAVYMASNAQGTPLALLHNLKHNKVLHEQVLLLTIQSEEEPTVPRDQRLSVERLSLGFRRVIGRYGFMEQPRVLELVKQLTETELDLRISETTFFLSRETVVAAKRRRMSRWRSVLFAFMHRNAQPATLFFGLPVNRVVEFGVQVEY